MKLDPVPLSTPISDSLTMSHPWFVWFRNLFQYVKESQTIVSASSNYQYCLNGNLLTINYSGNGDEKLNLPNKIAENQIINYWDGDILKKLEINKNDVKITIPTGVIKFTATIMVRVS